MIHHYIVTDGSGLWQIVENARFLEDGNRNIDQKECAQEIK